MTILLLLMMMMMIMLMMIMLMMVTGFARSVQLIECDVLVPARQALRPHVRQRWQDKHYDLTYDTGDKTSTTTSRTTTVTRQALRPHVRQRWQDKHYDLTYDTGDKAIQCGRHNDVFKLWLMWRAKGDTGFEKQVDYLMDLSRYSNIYMYLYYYKQKTVI